jgi:hypothetical protein
VALLRQQAEVEAQEILLLLLQHRELTVAIILGHLTTVLEAAVEHHKLALLEYQVYLVRVVMALLQLFQEHQ